MANAPLFPPNQMIGAAYPEFELAPERLLKVREHYSVQLKEAERQLEVSRDVITLLDELRGRAFKLAILSGRTTATHIDRMHAANPAINAIVVDLSAQAIEAARAADRALAQGATPGKLQGVPVTIKINIDVEGQANSNGVVAFKDNIAPGDSPVTANLKKAGAIAEEH